MRFILELVSEPTGYNIRRTELEKHPEVGDVFIASDLCLKDSIQHYLIVQDLMQGIEKQINQEWFQILEKNKTSRSYKLTYESIPLKEVIKKYEQ